MFLHIDQWFVHIHKKMLKCSISTSYFRLLSTLTSHRYYVFTPWHPLSYFPQHLIMLISVLISVLSHQTKSSLFCHCLLHTVIGLWISIIYSSDASGVIRSSQSVLVFTWQLTPRTSCVCMCVCVHTETFLKAELCLTGKLWHSMSLWSLLQLILLSPFSSMYSFLFILLHVLSFQTLIVWLIGSLLCRRIEPV